MSMEQPAESGVVEQMKQQIRTVLAEVAELARLDTTPETFHSEFLNRIVATMSALGGAVWAFDSQAGLSLSCQINMQSMRLQDDEEGNRQHSRLLYRMLEGPEGGTVVPPHATVAAAEPGAEAGNPTDYLLLFCPIRTELETAGLIEVVLRAETPAGAQRGYLRFLAQSCQSVTDFHKNRQLRHFGDRQSLWSLLEEFTRSIHRSLDVRQTAFTIVNEGRRLIECDRVTLALFRGGQCRVEAISGQDMVDKRATTVRQLGKLATAVVRSNEPIWYTGETTDFAPQVEKAVEAYVDQSHTKMLAVFPLARKQVLDSETEADRRRAKPEAPFAALIVEQIEDSRLTESLRRRVELVVEHASGALGNALDHHAIFLMPLWKAIGKSRVLVSARMLPKTIAVAVLLVTVIAALLFVPWKLQIPCDGKLETQFRKKIYSPLDAEVREVFVDHDSIVEGPRDGNPGTLLARLYSTEIEQLGEQILGEGVEIEKQIAALTRQRANEAKTLTAADITNFQGQLDVALARQRTNRQKQELYTEQRRQLEVTSPMDGIVVTWKLREKLDQLPVNRGQFLMEIVDHADGPWQLELAMPEKSMGHVMRQLALKKAAAEKNPELPVTLNVEFVLANTPEKKFHGVIAEIHDRAEVRTDTGAAAAGAAGGINTVVIRVRLTDPEKLPHSIRPGAQCSAKIDCGTASLGYVLLHDAIAFVRKNILFRFF